mgnify:CR=1 FL=1
MAMSAQPIQNNNQLQNQRAALALVEEIMHGYERDLAVCVEADMQESIRAKLYRVYILRFTMVHGIQAYISQQRQSA